MSGRAGHWPQTVLVAHNGHQIRGGDDGAFDNDAELLAGRGHRVVRVERDNDEIRDYGPAQHVRLALGTVWARGSRRAMADVLREERPDVAHFHNVLPLLSPSVLAACHRAGVPTVQTLHDFRLAPCVNAHLHRDGAVCERCLGRRVPWPGVVHRCYEGSLAGSAVLAASLGVHRITGSWARWVDVFVAVSEFERDVLVRAGLPAERVAVRHNFVASDPGPPPPGPRDGPALFVGRLVPEKGVAVLLDAFSTIDVPLDVVGDGPELEWLRAEVDRRRLTNVRVLGRLQPGDVLERMRRARLLVVPSTWYECFPLVVVEAYASGLPVVASRLGSLPEVVEEGVTGALAAPGDAPALAGVVASCWRAPDRLAAMGRAARARFTGTYSADRAYERLLEAYELAAHRRRSAR